jgi:hypothetical protein
MEKGISAICWDSPSVGEVFIQASNWPMSEGRIPYEGTARETADEWYNELIDAGYSVELERIA